MMHIRARRFHALAIICISIVIALSAGRAGVSLQSIVSTTKASQSLSRRGFPKFPVRTSSLCRVNHYGSSQWTSPHLHPIISRVPNSWSSAPAQVVVAGTVAGAPQGNAAIEPNHSSSRRFAPNEVQSGYSQRLDRQTVRGRRRIQSKWSNKGHENSNRTVNRKHSLGQRRVPDWQSALQVLVNMDYFEDSMKAVKAIGEHRCAALVITLARGGEWETAIRLLLDLNSGQVGKDSSANRIMNSEVLSIEDFTTDDFNDMRECSWRWKALSAVLSSYSRADRVDLMLSHFDAFGGTSDVRLSNVVLRELRKHEPARYWPIALNIFERLCNDSTQKMGQESSILASRKTISDERKTREDSNDQSSFSMGPNDITFEVMISLLVDAGESERATAVASCVRRWSPGYAREAYNLLIARFSRIGAWRNALKAIDHMGSARLAPDKIAYTKAMAACVREGEWNQALGLLDSMRERKVRPDAKTLTTLLKATEAMSDWTMGLSLLDSFETTGEARPSPIAYTPLIRLLANVGRWQDALALVDRLRQANSSPDALLYAIMMQAMARDTTGGWAAALSLFGAMMTDKVKPLHQAVTSAVVACGTGGIWETALKIIDEARSVSVQPTVITYNALLSVCSRLGARGMAVEVFTRMQAEGVNPDGNSYAALINHKSNEDGPSINGELEVEMAIIASRGVNSDGIINPAPYTMLINAYGKVGMWKHALRLIDKMQAVQAKPNVITYNALISTLDLCHQSDGILDIMDRMTKENIKPDPITYTAIIKSYAKTASWEQALYFLRKARKSEGNVDVILYNTVFDVLGKAGRWQKALELFDLMQLDKLSPDRVTYATLLRSTRGPHGRQSKDVDGIEQPSLSPPPFQALPAKPNVYTYVNLIAACGRSGEWARAREVFNSMHKVQVKPNQVAFNALIAAYGRAGAWELAIDAFSRMKSAGISASGASFTSLITACAKAGEWARAQALFKEMGREHVRPNAIVCTALIGAYSRAGRLDRALDVLRAMKAGRVNPTLVTYNSLISACVRNNELDRALIVFDIMTATRMNPDIHTFSSLISGYARKGDWDKALQIFKHMEKADLKANVVTYSALMSAYSSVQLWNEAEKVAEEMQAKEIQHNVVSYTTLIGAYANAGEWERALTSFVKMPKLGLKPDVFTYNRVIRALSTAGKADLAMNLFTQMSEASVAPDANTYDALADDQPAGFFNSETQYIDDIPEDYGTLNEYGNERAVDAPHVGPGASGTRSKGMYSHTHSHVRSAADFSLVDVEDADEEGTFSIVLAAAGEGDADGDEEEWRQAPLDEEIDNDAGSTKPGRVRV